MISPNSFQISKNWWMQFPYPLRLLTKIRFYAAFGAGGVIYLTSLIFNNIGLSAIFVADNPILLKMSDVK